MQPPGCFSNPPAMKRALLTLALLLPACSPEPQAANNDPASLEADVPSKGIDRSHKGQAAPDVAITGPDGEETSLSELRGPLLVNLWATWCAPCVKELPTLNALAGSHDEDGAPAVVAVSQDMGPQGSVEAFLAKLKVDNLGAYHDPKMALSGALSAQVLPTTILYDAQGKEVWRYVGDLDWTGEEARKLLAEVPSVAKR